jgi:Predicted pPIWI-associating nuclease
MVAFVDADIEDLLTLFRTLNDGTHGSAGTFTVQQLLKLKKRAEDSILFITALNMN